MPQQPRIPAWRRAASASALAAFERDTAYGKYDLKNAERWWRECNDMLEAHGYRLRDRFRKRWIPSWTGTDLDPQYCEDSIALIHAEVIDAVRVQDDIRVMIKRVHIDSESPEVDIIRKPNDPEERKNALNHCIPVLEIFNDPLMPQYDFMVMPLMHKFDQPPFVSSQEALDFMRQTLEGLVYLHSHHIAHRDCAQGNIVMEPTGVYPEGFHPTQQHLHQSGAGLARTIPRSRVQTPVQYYFIDFGHSTIAKDISAPLLVLGLDGQDREVPELSNEAPYDPFAVDIFTLGNVFKNTFLNVYNNMEAIRPLVVQMTARDPGDRPVAEKALQEFHALTRDVHNTRLGRLDEGTLKSAILTLFYWSSNGMYAVQRIRSTIKSIA